MGFIGTTEVVPCYKAAPTRIFDSFCCRCGEKAADFGDVGHPGALRWPAFFRDVRVKTRAWSKSGTMGGVSDLLWTSKIPDSGRFFGDTSEYMRISVNWKDRKLVIFNVH
jgi:hypothetical protein